MPNVEPLPFDSSKVQKSPQRLAKVSMPVFHVPNIEPLDFHELEIQSVDGWSPLERGDNFRRLVSLAVEFKKSIMSTIPIPVYKRQKMKFCSTYFGASLELSFHDHRSSTIDEEDLWSWVYHCRRAYAPFPPPNPTFR